VGQQSNIHLAVIIQKYLTVAPPTTYSLLVSHFSYHSTDNVRPTNT